MKQGNGEQQANQVRQANAVRQAQEIEGRNRPAAEKCQVEAGARFGGSHQQIHGAKRVGKFHVFGGTAELALLGVAIGAAEIAFLGDGERQRAQRRRRQRRIVDERARDKAGFAQQPIDRLGAAFDRLTVACEQAGIGVEQPAAVGDKEMAAQRALDQVKLRRARLRNAHVVTRVGEAHGSPSVSSGTSRPPIWNFSTCSHLANSSSYIRSRVSA